ncbi:hypothetical protein HYH03_016951 [Edaphochlamys debaryana]|uniref:Peptidase M48 domain-containing protein n=1 Tax=Edaphochlamys debaryana TaxID=47281 RepID=A0A835XI43_9CHLO|nr:hypothetical protein HYH03_016951 [Edaphochlamys debaryana]|eukprot:KAG2484216.1 hypothetical protein HYH03_016951 [Edaphochlamys debaryana]
MAASGAARAGMAAGGLLKGYLAPCSAGTGAFALAGHLAKGGLLQHRAVSSLVPVAAAAARAPLRGLGGALSAMATAAASAGGSGLGLAAAAPQAVAEARLGGAMGMATQAELQTSSLQAAKELNERQMHLHFGTWGVLGLMLSGYAICWGESRTEMVPYTGRSHMIALAPPKVAWLFKLDWWRALFWLFGGAPATIDIAYNHPDAVRVRRVGAAVVAAAAAGGGGGSWEHVKAAPWQFRVVADSTGVPRAWVTADAEVVVNMDMLRGVVGDDDNVLAALLAHEAGHVLARHHDERLVTFLPLLVVSSSLLLLARPPRSVNTTISATFFEHLYTMHCNRRDEYEADHIGVHLTARAGYNPAGFATFLERLSEKEEEIRARRSFIKLPWYMFSDLVWYTHPPTPGRIARVKQQLHSQPVTQEEPAAGGFGSWPGSRAEDGVAG